MLLTRMSEQEIRRLIRKHNMKAEGGKGIDAAAVLARVEEDRTRAYAISVNGITEQASLIAMLLPTPATGKPLVVVAGLTDRVLASEKRYVETMTNSVGR